MERTGLAGSGGAGAERRTVAPADADDAGATGLARRPGRQENPGVGVGWWAARAPPCGCRRQGYDLRQLARATCTGPGLRGTRGAGPCDPFEGDVVDLGRSPTRPSTSSFIRAPLEFGHTLEDQIGGQIAAGFSICWLIRGRLVRRPCATSPADEVLHRNARAEHEGVANRVSRFSIRFLHR